MARRLYKQFDDRLCLPVAGAATRKAWSTEVLRGIIKVTYFAGGKAGLTAEIRQGAQRTRREETYCILFLFSAVFSVVFSAVNSFVGVKDAPPYLRHRTLRCSTHTSFLGKDGRAERHIEEKSPKATRDKRDSFFCNNFSATSCPFISRDKRYGVASVL